MKKMFNLKNLGYFSILVIPLYLVRFSFWGMPINLFEIVALITSGLFLSRVVSLENKLREQKAYGIPIVMLICGLLLSAQYSDNYKRELGIIKSWFLVPIIFSWICCQLFENKKDILRAIYASSFAVACFSLGYFLVGDVTFDGRLQAFYNSPNFLAMYLAPAIIIGTYFFKENSKFYFGSLAVVISIFYFTQSYAAWLAIFVSFGAIGIVRKMSGAVEWKKILALILVVGTLIFLQKGTDKFSALTNLENRSSFASRIMIWRSALRIGLDNPIRGIGPGNFQDKYLEYQKHSPPYLEWAVPQPHNLFLAFWLQGGLIGLAGFVWIIFVWLKGFVQSREKRKEDFVCLGILIYIIVHGLFDTTYFKNDLAVIFWLIIFCYKKTSTQKSSCWSLCEKQEARA